MKPDQEDDIDALIRTHLPRRFRGAPTLSKVPEAVSSPPPLLRGALYARESADGYEQDDFETQFAKLEADFAARGIEPVARFKDDHRAGVTRNGRPGLLALLRRAGRDFDVVGVVSVCRFSRHHRLLYALGSELERKGVRLYEKGSGFVTDVIMALNGHLAEEARTQGLDRMEAGARQAARAGFAKGDPVFGYQVVPGFPGARLPHPIFAPIVMEMYERCDQGEPVDEITASLRCPTPDQWLEMERAGVKDGGRPWKPYMGYRILQNPLNKGVLKYGTTRRVRNGDTFRPLSVKPAEFQDWIVVHVSHLEIVDGALWTRVQQRLSQASRGHGGATGRNWTMFRGLAACSVCGQPVGGDFGLHNPNPFYVCRRTDACRASRATIGLVERAALRAIDRLLREHWTDDHGLLDARGDAWRAEFDVLERDFSSEAEKITTGAAPEARTREAMRRRRRYESLARLLLGDEDDSVDVGLFLEYIKTALSASGADLIEDPTRELWDAVRAVVTGVAVGRSGRHTATDLSLDLGPVATQIDVVDLFPTLRLLVDDPQQDDEARSQVVEQRARSDAQQVLHNARFAIDERGTAILIGLGDDVFRLRLVALGWSLPTLLQACAVWVRSGVDGTDQAGAFGNAATFRDALRLVRGAGLRGEIFTVVADHGAGFEGAHRRLFGLEQGVRSQGVTQLVPNLERAITGASIETVEAADTDDALGLDLRRGLASWLAASKNKSQPALNPVGDHSLTQCLAAIRKHGLQHLLSEGPPTIEVLLHELDEAVEGESDEYLACRADIVRGHLAGMTTWQLERARGLWAGYATPVICRYRAMGPLGLRSSARDRLSAEQWSEVLLLAKGAEGDNPGVSVEALVALCAERFGVRYSMYGMRARLASSGIRLPYREAGKRLAHRQAKANEFLGFEFET